MVEMYRRRRHESIAAKDGGALAKCGRWTHEATASNCVREERGFPLDELGDMQTTPGNNFEKYRVITWKKGMNSPP